MAQSRHQALCFQVGCDWDHSSFDPGHWNRTSTDRTRSKAATRVTFMGAQLELYIQRAGQKWMDQGYHT
jgi:hypothetical protein